MTAAPPFADEVSQQAALVHCAYANATQFANDCLYDTAVLTTALTGIVPQNAVMQQIATTELTNQFLSLQGQCTVGGALSFSFSYSVPTLPQCPAVRR